MSKLMPAPRLEDWQVICQFLPVGWEAAAKQLGALRRRRGIANAATLLRTLLTHLADGCSLQETAVRAAQAGWCSVSAVALFKRLRAAEHWLRWLAESLWRPRRRVVRTADYRVRAVDATTVQESGSTGTDWRVHYALDLGSLQCDFFEVTDAKGGETFRRVPVKAGELVLGDRVYGTPPGLEDVVGRGADVLVRVNQKALPLWDFRGHRFPLTARLRRLPARQVGEWVAWVRGPHRTLRGRLIALRLSRRAARLARKRMRSRANRRQLTVTAEAIYLAGFVFLWTSVPQSAGSAKQLLGLYRARWQIELAFKRMKSLIGLGQLPKKSDASSRAWLYGKLFLALLVERILEAAESFSPRPAEGGESAEPVARGGVHVP
jgi:DDE family transposase